MVSILTTPLNLIYGVREHDFAFGNLKFGGNAQVCILLCMFWINGYIPSSHIYIYIYILRLLHKAVGFIIHLFCGTTGLRTALKLQILNDNSVQFSPYIYLFALFFSVETMRLLKIPEKRPQYRKNRQHEYFLTSLSNHVKSDVKEDRHVSFYYDCKILTFVVTYSL